MIQVGPRRARFDAGVAPRRIDPDTFHAGEIDHDPTVAERGAGNVVARSPHSGQQIALTGEVDSRHDVRHTGAADDRCWPSVDHPIVDSANLVVFNLLGQDELSAETRAEPLES